MNLKQRKRKERTFQIACKIITWTSILILIVLLTHLFVKGYAKINLNFITNFQSRFPDQAGIKAGIVGTLWMVSLTCLFSVPIGVATAVFLEEYGIKGRLGKIIEINVNNLAGVPSIVYGLLGLAIFVRYLGLGRSVLAGALTMALVILPIVVVASRESIRSVPDRIKFAAYALGAKKYQVIWGHTLPCALPGILTGVILALSRAIGESAPLIIIGALSYVAYTPQSVMDEFTVLPIQIYNWASRPQVEFHHLAAGGILILLFIMLCMNFTAIYIRHKTQKKYKV